MKRDQRNLEFIYKKLCIYSYVFKLKPASKYSPFDAIHLMRNFFHYSTVFELVDFDAFQCFCHFWFHLFHIAKMFLSLWGLFSSGETNKKSHSGRDLMNRECGAWVHVVFGQKLLNTQCSVGSFAGKLPVMKLANTEKSLQKKFTEAEHSLSQQHQLVHWYGWVPRTLT